MMTADPGAETWSPDRNFLLLHGLLPLAAATFVLSLAEFTGLDLWLADHWYAFEGGSWSLKNHWLTSELIHHRGKQAVIVVALVLLVGVIASRRSSRLRRWRAPAAYLLTCMAVLPGIVAGMKRFSTVPCPWSLARYGGDLAYQHSLQYAWSWNGGGNCFPAGHASGAYVLLALYFAAIGRVRRPAWFLLPGLIVGGVFGFAQQARGAHFLSHDLWTLSICWFGVLILFLVMRPDARARRAV